jgi:hypothetical protein
VSSAGPVHLGNQVLAINGAAYDTDVLKEAIPSSAVAKSPIELIVKSANRLRIVTLDYHDGLRYPHQERDTSIPARLHDILAA